jgi:hypothetical protein
MDAYNLIGTLIELEQTEPILDAIRNAKVKHRPKRNFIVITSQVNHPAHRTALKAMIKDRFPKCQGIIYITKERKMRLLYDFKIKSYTDNNDQYLNDIQEQCPHLKLYRITNNRARIPFNG